MSENRKLVAIMFTDIVGYTALMGKSESSALKFLKTNLLIHQKQIEKYNGKIVKELGDGILAIFENVTESVYCGIEIQKETRLEKIPLRIGIHEGEVVVKNGDVFGDEVNIASRIQGESASGGICISNNVYRIIRNKEGLKAESIGKKILKNVKEPMILYQLISPSLATRSLYKPKKISSWTLFFAVLSGILTCIILLHLFTQSNDQDEVRHLSILLPDDIPRSNVGFNSFAISPDGSRIVYTAKVGGSTMLYNRPLNESAVEGIPGTEGAENPFFSPTGQYIGFFSDGMLRKVFHSGGKVTDLYNVSEYGSAIWLPNDSIVIGGIPGEGLKIISANGGLAYNLTTTKIEHGEWKHNAPSHIIGTDKILYVVESGSRLNISINLINSKTKEEKVLIPDAGAPKYIRSGHLLHVTDGAIYANVFDVEKDIISESSILLIEGNESTTGNERIQYQVSDEGDFVYSIDQGQNWQGELVLVDMEGKTIPVMSIHRKYIGPKFSPDGSNLAFWIAENDDAQVWIYNFPRESLTKFTSVGQNFWPIWTPDGKSIYFPSFRTGSSLNTFGKSLKAMETLELLLKNSQPKAFTKDGNLLLYHQLGKENDRDISIYNMKNRESEPFLDSNFDEGKPDFSPDDKWVIYESNESGIFEVYVTDFPNKSIKKQISSLGGYEPIWSHKGDRIIYRNKDDFYVVNVERKDEISFSKPEILFSGKYQYDRKYGRYYDLSPDEKYIVAVKETTTDTTISSLNVITNFYEEVKQKTAK